MLNEFNFHITKFSLKCIFSFFVLSFFVCLKADNEESWTKILNKIGKNNLKENRRSAEALKKVKLIEMCGKISPKIEKIVKDLKNRVMFLNPNFDQDKKKRHKNDILAELQNLEKILEEKRKNPTTNIATNNEQLENDIEQLRDKIDSLKNYQEALDEGGEKAEKISQTYLKEIEVKENLLDYLNSEVSGGGWGDIILRGIAGKYWETIEDQKKVGNNILEGVGKGVMLRTAVSTGNAVGDIIDRYVQTLFDSTLGKFESFLSFLYRVVFHSACRPFTEEELVIWKKLVSDDFREIEMMIKNAEKLDSRSKADILREYETEQEPEAQTLNLWQDFVEDHALTYEELAQEIELRKGYYKKEANGFGVVNCADRLINKLLKIRTWLLSVKSLRDFANIPEAKSIIPAMRKSIDNYFVNLANQVKPLNSKKTTKLNFGDSGFSKKDHWGNDFGEGSSYPGYMTE